MIGTCVLIALFFMFNCTRVATIPGKEWDMYFICMLVQTIVLYFICMELFSWSLQFK